MNLRNLIAISGTKNSGKTVAAEMFQYCLSVPKIFRQYWFYKIFRRFIHHKWKLVAFADPVKQMLADLINIPVEKFNDREFKEFTYVDLQSLNLINSMKYEFTSRYYPDKLSDSKFNRLAKDLNPEISKYCLSIRQLMQYFATNVMRTYFGENVWINSALSNISNNIIISDCRFKNEASAIKNKNGIIIYINRPNTPFGQHQSEKEMEWMLNNDVYDYIINNDGSLEDLFNSVKLLVNTWQAEKL